VSLRVFHDVGSPINYTITLRKPTAADNYAGTTAIATSSAIAVASGVDTLIKLENVALGDVTNGLEVQVDAASGAVTSKNFHFTEWQIEESTIATTFERRPYEQDLRNCQRFFEKGQANITKDLNSGAAVTTQYPVPFKITKRATPTFTNNTTGLSNASSASAIAIDAEYMAIQVVPNTFGASTCGAQIAWTASADL
jgi:hypothetical protein